ncbi:hypothetical protein FA15DRAFT_705075 [Coprinopsis marcescibilis]|uniref:Autophagy-related protein 13 n=1 Tax=Coprinopsis marcescibilis TaxID=230819 RepID=A0A5C3KUB3_COPMA|nr:hypothetical protein FA15DRAFT_705075 [Coprinopsis marcescibilis]
MSNDTQKADQIAFHFYTKLFYVVNQARATEEARGQAKVDKWFNLETPDSDLFTREAREVYKNISLAPQPGPPPLEIQVVIAVPELANNQVLVYLTPEGSRARIEPTPRFIVLETWTLSFAPRRGNEDHSIDVALPTIYKHGIPLFRSLYSLLRVLPTWKLYKRLKRRTGGPHHLSIQLRVRGVHDADHVTLNLDTPLSASVLSTPLSTQTHTFSPVPHPLGSLTLSARYLEAPNFQLEELESVLSSKFISQDLDGGGDFVPTLTKNHQRDSSIGSSNSNSNSVMQRSPPKRADEGTSIADRFILPPVRATPSTGRTIPQPPRQLASGDFAGSIHNQSPSGLAISRIRKESLGSSPSPSLSIRDLPAGIPFSTTNPSLSSLSSSPSSGPLPIRRPHLNPFKSNTVSSASGSSPSLSIRQAGLPSDSPVTHSRSTSISGTAGRPPHSPIGATLPSPGLDAGKRPGTSGSGGSANSNSDLRDSPDDGRVGVPPRKRYSSSFGHRYANSVGSTGGASGEGGGSASGRSTPAHQPTGLGIEVPRERKESTAGLMGSFVSTATDDDDISIFVQEIDSRKPLSGRHKEKEKRDWDRQQRALESDFDTSAVVHDGTRPGSEHSQGASEASTIKANRFSPQRAGSSGAGSSTTSPTSTAPSSRFSTASRATVVPGSVGSVRDRPLADTSTSPPALSMSPNRGPMLTSQGEVEERLRKMNETFLKSLEGFGSNATKRKEREQRKKDKERERAVPTSPRKSTTDAHSRYRGGAGVDEEDVDNLADYAGRGLCIRSARERRLDDWREGTDSASSASNVGYPGLRLGYANELGQSGDGDGGASQGSEEVIGKMDLYEDRRSGGYRF